MTRYIDADALYASIAKDTYMLRDRINSRDYGMYLIGIKEKIDEAPTADVVEVVRCKDCEHYESDGGALITCTLTDLIVNDDDYCSYGERRE